MFIFDHAKDIWYLVISLCAITFTAFAAIFMYYLVRAAKEVEQAASGIKRQVDSIEEIISGFRNKFLTYFSYAAIAGQVAKKIADIFKADGFDFKKGEKGSKKGKKRAKHDPNSDFMQEEL